MPTKDIYHQGVKNALIKAGWMITHDPLVLQFGGVDLYVDLGAEKMLAAEKNGQQIAVEIKTFAQKSFVYEFHLTMGQFINYRHVLTETEPERMLYLAIPEDTYDAYFKLLFTQSILESYQVKFFVYNTEQEVIVKWKM
jgi:hypothetical protein